MKKDFRVLLFYPNTPLQGIAPSNLSILSACLKKDGFEVRLFDTTIYKPKNVKTNDDLRVKFGHVLPTSIDDYFKAKEVDIYDDFIRLVDEYKPNLIGFSVIDSTIAFSLSFIEKIRDKIKEKNIKILTGGVGSTFGYEKILNSDLVDFACIGEGEGAIVELSNKLYNNEDCSEIRNIYLKKNNKIIKNTLRPLVDINTLPLPDYTIYEDYRFYRPYFGKVVKMMRVDTDRGCPHNCTYCAVPGLKQIFKENGCAQYYRTKNIDKIFEEINDVINNYGADFLSFPAESFLSIPIKKLKEFAERYKKEIGLPFVCQTRLDTFTEEKTRLLYEMGCRSFATGLEHGSEEIRKDLLDKHLSNKQILNAFKELAKYDIVPGINNMIGLPDETRENVFETIKLNKQVVNILNGKYTLNVFTFIPFHGTKLRELCIEKGYITGDEEIPFDNPWFNHSLLTMPSMSKEEIYGLEKTFALYVSLPESYFPDIKIAEQDNEEGDEMFEKLMEIKNEKYNKK